MHVLFCFQPLITCGTAVLFVCSDQTEFVVSFLVWLVLSHQRIRVGSEAIRWIQVIWKCDVSPLCCQPVKEFGHSSQRAHSAVSHEHVKAGVVHWSLIFVEHHNHVQFKMFFSYFLTKKSHIFSFDLFFIFCFWSSFFFSLVFLPDDPFAGPPLCFSAPLRDRPLPDRLPVDRPSAGPLPRRTPLRSTAQNFVFFSPPVANFVLSSVWGLFRGVGAAVQGHGPPK